MSTIIKEANVSRIDMINARASHPYEDLVGNSVPVKGAAITRGLDEDGEEKEYSYIFSDNGAVYGGNSATVKNAVDELIDLMADEPNTVFTASIRKEKSKSGREFNLLVVGTLD